MKRFIKYLCALIAVIMIALSLPLSVLAAQEDTESASYPAGEEQTVQTEETEEAAEPETEETAEEAVPEEAAPEAAAPEFSFL